MIPSKIKVGNMVYDVEFVDESDDYLGSTTHSGNLCLIRLSRELSGDKLRNVFIHELLHAMLFEIGAMELNNDELFVQSFANEIDKLFKLRWKKR